MTVMGVRDVRMLVPERFMGVGMGVLAVPIRKGGAGQVEVIMVEIVMSVPVLVGDGEVIMGVGVALGDEEVRPGSHHRKGKVKRALRRGGEDGERDDDPEKRCNGEEGSGPSRPNPAERKEEEDAGEAAITHETDGHRE